MPEKQNVEYKINWRDEWLKWICGFANSEGGKLFVGINDSGVVEGISDYKLLMDEIANKIKNILGISVEVNLHNNNKKYFIEIIVHPQLVAISYRGKYYKRVGSVNTELSGNSLNEFVLRKSGLTWDNCTEERASFKDIDESTVRKFIRMGKESMRLPEVEGLSLNEIIEKLRLSEGGKLKRAAIILFGKDPNRFYPNIAIKIGEFGSSDVNLIAEVVEEGNLFQILENSISQLTRKFFKNKILFDGLLRKEKSQYPLPAIREIILNALVHRSYMGSMIQIRVYPNRLTVWNEGELQQGITIQKLLKQHPSVLRNPLIADVCYKCGLIDAWGRGIQKIISSCNEENLPAPFIQEIFGGLMIEISSEPISSGSEKTAESTEKTAESTEKTVNKIIELIENDSKITSAKLAEIIGVSPRNIEKHIAKLKLLGKLKRIGSPKGGYWEVNNF